MKKKKEEEEEEREREEERSFSLFVAAYPAAKRKGGDRAKAVFVKALRKVSLDAMLAALTQHKRSEQWQNPRFIPAFVTWLEEERWIQVLPEPERKLTPWEMARRYGYK